MGRIKKGILGGFSGKVGTVVGGNWKQVAYMRSLPQKVHNPRTEAQRKQRSKFAIVVSYLKPMTSFLRTGWKLHAGNQSPFNAAMAYTIANAITGDYPNYQITPSKVLVSCGSLTPPINGNIVGAAGKITFSWFKDYPANAQTNTDKALIVIFNTQKGEVITDTNGTTRATGTQDVTIPASWAGDTAECYLGFISKDLKEVSNSVHLGTMPCA